MAALVWLFAVAMAQLGPVLFMPLFYKFQPLDDPELVQRSPAGSTRRHAGTGRLCDGHEQADYLRQRHAHRPGRYPAHHPGRHAPQRLHP